MIESAMEVCLIVREARHGLIASEVLFRYDSASWQTVVLISAFDVSKQWIQESTFSLPLKHLIDLAIEALIILANR